VGGFEIDEVMDFLPHRYPFLMVDRVLEVEDGKYIKAMKNVTINEPHFLGHFPGFPIMPGVLIVEGMAQTAGLMLKEMGRKTMENPIPLLLGIDKARFKKPVRPGDTLIYEVNLVGERFGTYTVNGKALVDGKIAASATLIFGIRNAKELKEG